MGHVDHGKTTLLDTIRKAKVASGEAGGITQHIGAYSVQTDSGKTIAFLDTPGHAAFAAMRQRGASATDVVVLVVAGDDGVMPQTRESIKFCENAGVPIIVAVNKMDKPGVNPDRVKQELSDFNLMPEEWGGQTQYVHVSALKGQGIDELLEAILLQAEMLDLRANPKGNVEGVVIESKIEAGRGPMATILVKEGTLNRGDSIVVGESYGRARSLTDHTGANLESAGPSTPIQIFGLEGCPSPGDILNVVKNDREAKKIAENRVNERKLLSAAPEKKKTSLEDFFAAASGKGEEQKVLNLIIRSDVQGSYEAIKSSLETLGNAEVTVKIIGGGVGPITDSDVNLASASGGFIFGFNMRPVTSARKLAEDKGVDIKNYSIIYELINDVKLALEGLLDPEYVEEFIGRAEVREVFNIPKAGVIAGSYVIDGKIASGCNIRLLRNGKIIHDGKMSSLKRFKDDAKEVKNGYECGIALEGFTEIKAQDIFEAYMMVQKKRTLDDAAGLTSSGSKEQRPML
jgi:translation initiation factor IF-2